MRRKAAAALGLFVLFSPTATADDAPKPRPRIGVAFGGGGARGGAHVGVLKVLEELRIPVDYIAGTSIGSIVGGLYATGLSPGEMDEILRHTDWDAVLDDDPARKDIWYRRKEDDNLYLVKADLGFSKGKLVLPTGLLAGEKLGLLLRKMTLPFSEVRDFDAFPIPYRCVATDIGNGGKVVLGHGDIAHAMRASMAIPAFFTAQLIDGKLLTDGGTVDNLPVDVVRKMGADVVIAIDIGTPLKGQEHLTNFFAIANQLTGLLTVGNVRESIESLKPADVLITPDLEGVASFNFAQFPEGIQRGYDAAEALKDRLKTLSVSEEEYAAFLKKQRYPHPTPNVDAVKVAPVPGIDPRILEARVDYRKKGPVDWADVDRTLGNIFELNDFSTVDFRIVPVDGVPTLVVEPHLKKSAPTRMRFGLLLNTDFSGSSAFAFRASYNQTQMNALRGEWKTQVEVGQADYLTTQWYQPVDYAGRFFVMPEVGIQRQPFNLFIDQQAIGRYLVDDVFASLQGGISFGPLGQLAVGLRRDWYKYKENISVFPVVDTTQDQTSLVARLNLDQLDSIAFPRSGYQASVQFLNANKALGGESSFNRLSAGFEWAKSRGDWTLVFAANGVTKIGKNEFTFVNAAFLGGFLNLSGTQPAQLWGNYAAIGRLIAYRRMLKLPSLVGTGVYLGASFESGNAWITSDQITFGSLRVAGSLFLGADTILGPLYLAWGRADGGFHSFYFALGLPFN